MREWKSKPVNFKRTNKEHMELYQIAGSLPNFSAAVLDMLRAIRDGRRGQEAVYAAYGPPTAVRGQTPEAPSYHFVAEPQEAGGDEQFLL